MILSDVLKIIAVLLTIFGTAYAAVRFVLSEREKQTRLEQEKNKLQQQLDMVSTSLREGVTSYQPLREISTSAQVAIGAELHSISIPVPRSNPTHLKIIMSTDPKANKIIGKEFPITKGLAGRVYNTQRPEYVNRASDDPNHYKLVDQAAGTKTGEGGILSHPLVTAGTCYGVIQFMKSPGTKLFSDEDLEIVARFAGKIASELAKLEQIASDDPRLGSLPQRFASVLFTDINDYNHIRRQMSLYQLVSLLDEYYRRMLEIALSHGAAFEEYLGDGLYLSFHGSAKNEVVASAISCALEMQRTFTILKSEWIAYEYPISDDNYHNIGIASGEVFEGLVGHSQHRRRKLIGSTVDMAAHFVEIGKKFGGCILVDTATRDLAPPIETHFEEKPGEPKCYILREKNGLTTREPGNEA